MAPKDLLSDTGGPAARDRILVVDDDPDILTVVGETLELEGFEVLTANSGEAALAVIDEEGLPHLAVVDIVMPGIDGVELCRRIQAYSDLPVIMLTAVGEQETVVSALDEVAEDYVQKPFQPAELAARVRRVLRRMGNFDYAQGRTTVVDERLVVDFAHQSVSVDGKSHALTPKESKLLYLLLRGADRTLSTGFLLGRLWPLEEVYEDALRVHVHRLRHKIEPDPSNPTYLLTERGVGYRFVRS